MKHFFEGFPPTAHPMAILARWSSALSSYYPDALDVDNVDAARHHDRAPRVEGPDHRGVRLQEVDRAAVRLSEELALVLRELPQHDVLGPGRGLRGRPRAREGDEPSAHPARRPRAELLDEHGARRRARARRTCSRRSAPASARSGARSTAARTRKCSRCSTAIHADGGDVKKYVALAKDKNSDFKLMGFGHRVYKNFDPRAKIIKAAADKVLAQARHATTRSSTSRRRSKRRRSRTATSSSGSSTRTSTSTRASSTARWASRRTCSRCSSRSVASRAGSPTGRR